MSVQMKSELGHYKIAAHSQKGPLFSCFAVDDPQEVDIFKEVDC